MNALEKYRAWTLPVSLFSAAVVLAVGFWNGYLTGFQTDYDTYITELLADIHYVANPVDCPPCDEGATYERLYVERPLANQLPEGEATPTAKADQP